MTLFFVGVGSYSPVVVVPDVVVGVVDFVDDVDVVVVVVVVDDRSEIDPLSFGSNFHFFGW